MIRWYMMRIKVGTFPEALAGALRASPILFRLLLCYVRLLSQQLPASLDCGSGRQMPKFATSRYISQIRRSLGRYSVAAAGVAAAEAGAHRETPSKPSSGPLGRERLQLWTFLVLAFATTAPTCSVADYYAISGRLRSSRT